MFRQYREPEKIREILELEGWSLVPVALDGIAASWRLQSNRVADAGYEQHVVVWAAGGRSVTKEERRNGTGGGEGFVEALQPGDRVGLWMRAMYRGWENYTRCAGIEVMYEFR